MKPSSNKIKWEKKFKKSNGELRKQYKYWKVPAHFLKAAELKDGDNFYSEIHFGNQIILKEVTLTSGGEISLQSKLSRSIEHFANKHPKSLISFEVLKFCESNANVEKNFQEEIVLSQKLTSSQRQKRLKTANKFPSKIITTSTVFERNPDVVAEVLHRAKGKCEQCKKIAPFRRASNNTPYLEVHHITRLADGGEDTIENALALCPNCHRKAHFGSQTRGPQKTK